MSNQLTKPYVLPFGELLVSIEVEWLQKPSTIQARFLEDWDEQRGAG